ncbi:MAG: phosphatidylglycerophosphatase A [Bryobacter sp.]|nr:phosphatidylglycerophosphatase A [Bryobacter sp.]
MRSALAEAWATAFYAGYVPKAPGTAGALVGVLLAFLLQRFAFFTGWHLAALAAVLLPASVWAANVVIAESGLKDPQMVVMDEVLGQLLVFGGLGLGNATPLAYVVAFVLFRFFDITKVFPVNHLEKLPRGWGVMLDDYGAGVYGAVVLGVLRGYGLV